MSVCVAKPWGNYEVLKVDDNFQVKRIEVNPEHRLSYQRHKQRSEKWTIVNGKGIVTLEDKDFSVEVGSVIEIPEMAKHRIKNSGDTPLIFIEVQLGSYLGEDDIERLDDDYNRS